MKSIVSAINQVIMILAIFTSVFFNIYEDAMFPMSVGM